MKPKSNSKILLGIVSAKAKMWEYHLPPAVHIEIKHNPSIFFDFTIAALGDLSAHINGESTCDFVEINNLYSNVRFAARFFECFNYSKLDESLCDFSMLCASTCFYLCDTPGSSHVFSEKMNAEEVNLGGNGIDRALLLLLQDKALASQPLDNNRYSDSLHEIFELYNTFKTSGQNLQELKKATNDFRSLCYLKGSPADLFFSDALCAVIHKRISNSTWVCLPEYSDLPIGEWMNTIQKETFIRELWPAQKLLGEKGVLKGKSAIVQMPTSAGKTRGAELFIRSAFLSKRVELVVVVAPYRSLCHEIGDSMKKAFFGEMVSIDELTDVLQYDYDIILESLQKQFGILIVTPEKLHYVLRHEPLLASKIGLVVYDEGHLFDDSSRGVNYELLLTSIKSQLPENAQTILISAVISNAEQICKWLLGENGIVIKGHNIAPTERTIGFASWTTSRGQINFPAIDGLQDYDFFVPRVLHAQQLALKGKETKPQLFPTKENSNDISLFLALSLVPNGGCAIFCGRKGTVSGICERAVDIFSRRLSMEKPTQFSNIEEVRKLTNLNMKHFGENAIPTKSSQLGIYSHSGNTPQGVRLAIEHALHHDLIKLVICTSTLAQGVNLPLRYLIVSGVYQGLNRRIKIRDFQNLIGRAGRAGKHTEGSIIFADPKIFDKRNSSTDDWRWQQAQELLDPVNSEKCSSVIAKILSPLLSDNGRQYIDTKPLYLTKLSIEKPQDFLKLSDVIAERNEGFSSDSIHQQLNIKLNAIKAIEGYLLAHHDIWSDKIEDVDDLVEETLAYSLADDSNKTILKELFQLLAKNILEQVPDVTKRHAYGRTLLGMYECIEVEKWIHENLDAMSAQSTSEALLEILWPLLYSQIQNKYIKKCTPNESLIEVAKAWINGYSFGEIFDSYLRDIRLGTTPRAHKLKMEQVVDMCENGLGYDGTLIIGAINELLSEDRADLIKKLSELQKRLKYGISSQASISLYELGIADRSLVEEIASHINDPKLASKRKVLRWLKSNESEIRQLSNNYPDYFRIKLEQILNS